jgi:hypothetical protein
MIDSLMATIVIPTDNNLIEDILDELNIEQGIKIMKHYNMPDIYSNLLDRLFINNWKCGSNDDFVATVRLADKMHYNIVNDLDITNCIDTCNISNELSFLEINNFYDHYNLVKIIVD